MKIVCSQLLRARFHPARGSSRTARRLSSLSDRLTLTEWGKYSVRLSRRFVAESMRQDQGPRGKVIDFRTPVEIEGVRIAPGDLIFGDREGVLIVPAEVESEAVAAALAKASTENKVATAIRGGRSAREALETFGVL